MAIQGFSVTKLIRSDVYDQAFYADLAGNSFSGTVILAMLASVVWSTPWVKEVDDEEISSDIGSSSLCVDETQDSDNNQGGSSYAVDAEAGVGAGRLASGLVSQRPQTPVLKTKKRKRTGASRKAAKKQRRQVP